MASPVTTVLCQRLDLPDQLAGVLLLTDGVLGRCRFIAAQNGHAEVAKILLQHATDPGMDTMGPLEVAVRNGHQPVVDVYRELKVGLDSGNSGDSCGVHVLQYAALNGLLIHAIRCVCYTDADHKAGPPKDYSECVDHFAPHCRGCIDGPSLAIHSLCSWHEQGLLCEQIRSPSQCKRFIHDGNPQSPPSFPLPPVS